MAEEPYTKREQDIFFKNLGEKFEQLFDRLDKQDITLSRIESNQNDFQIRISKIEDTISDYPDYKKLVETLVNYKWWVVGAIAAFTVLGGSMFFLIKSQLSNDIQNKISLGIDSAFNSRFSKIQVINNN